MFPRVWLVGFLWCLRSRLGFRLLMILMVALSSCLGLSSMRDVGLVFWCGCNVGLALGW